MSVNWNEIAIKNCPIVYMHRLEEYHMGSLEEWFDKTKPVYNKDENTWYRDYDGKFKKDGIIFNKNAPIYVFIREPPKISDAKEEIYTSFAKDVNEGDIDMWFCLWFDYNGPKRLLGIQPIEHHLCDLETFIIRFTKEGRPYKYFLSSHGDYQIFRKSEMSFENNHPIIYSSINSHALYRQSGTFIRFYGFGNDTTEKYENGKIEPVVKFLNEGNKVYDWPKYLNEYQSIHDSNYGKDGVGAISGLVNNIRFKSITEPFMITNTLNNIVFILLWCIIPLSITYIISNRRFINSMTKISFRLARFFANNNKLRIFIITFIVLVYFLKLLIFITIKIGKYAAIPDESILDWLQPLRFY